MMDSFTKWDNSLSGTLQAGLMGVRLSKVSLYLDCACKVSILFGNVCSLMSDTNA